MGSINFRSLPFLCSEKGTEERKSHNLNSINPGLFESLIANHPSPNAHNGTMNPTYEATVNQ